MVVERIRTYLELNFGDILTAFEVMHKQERQKKKKNPRLQPGKRKCCYRLCGACVPTSTPDAARPMPFIKGLCNMPGARPELIVPSSTFMPALLQHRRHTLCGRRTQPRIEKSKVLHTVMSGSLCYNPRTQHRQSARAEPERTCLKKGTASQ